MGDPFSYPPGGGSPPGGMGLYSGTDLTPQVRYLPYIDTYSIGALRQSLQNQGVWIRLTLPTYTF